MGATVLHLVRDVSETAGESRLLTNGGDGDERDVFHLSFDPEGEIVWEVVVSAVSVIHDVPPEELDPIADYVDPDALDELVAASGDSGEGVERVEFVYGKLNVHVDPDGHVWLQWV